MFLLGTFNTTGKRNLVRAVSSTSAVSDLSRFEAVHDHGKLEAPEAYSGYNKYYEQDRAEALPRELNVDKRAFTYLTLAGARFTYLSLGRAIVIKLAGTMSASADVLALSSLEVDIAALEAGNSLTVKWRGKPVFIRRRTAAEIEAVSTHIPSFVYINWHQHHNDPQSTFQSCDKWQLSEKRHNIWRKLIRWCEPM